MNDVKIKEKDISLKQTEPAEFVNFPHVKKQKAIKGDKDHIKQVRNMLKLEAIRK